MVGDRFFFSYHLGIYIEDFFYIFWYKYAMGIWQKKLFSIYLGIYILQESLYLS